MRWLYCILLCAPALAGLYLLAAVVGALVPANSGWQPPTRGITIFVRTNGVHTSIVVPARAAGVEWPRLIRPLHLERPDFAGDHFAFAWGQREFYLKTPRWSDLRFDVAVMALSGQGGTLVHVEHLFQPKPATNQRPVLVTPAQYRRLSHFILASFRLTADGTPASIAGYGATDSFYEAQGRYTLFRTSNEWTGALRRSGIRIGIWTPFA